MRWDTFLQRSERGSVAGTGGSPQPYARVVVQIALLGPLEVELSGRRVKVPSGKPSELLVRLALDAGELVRADRLIDELWAAGAMSTRRNTLQSKVAMLRRALGEPGLIVSSDGGYALAVEPSEVDALAAMDQVAAASRLLDAGDDRAAAELSASTLELFRGEVLQAAGDGDWVDPYRARLERDPGEASRDLVLGAAAARRRRQRDR